jgi:hypothetical protein
MTTVKNFASFILVAAITMTMILGCLSADSKKRTQDWREKELKAQETRADLAKRGDEFAKYSAPEKLVAEPYVKAPVVIVWIMPDGKTEIRDTNINRIKDHAQAAADAKSVFKIKCSEVPAGKYVFETGNKAEVPAFTSRCDTELYDKSIQALIHRKTFENTDLKESIKAGRFTGSVPDRVVSPIPEKAIEDFIYFVPRK